MTFAFIGLQGTAIVLYQCKKYDYFSYGWVNLRANDLSTDEHLLFFTVQRLLPRLKQQRKTIHKNNFLEGFFPE